MDISSDREKFEELSLKLNHLFYERSEGDLKLVNKILEDLGNLNYTYPIVNHHTKATLLINQCCSYVPIDDEILIPKCCRLIKTLISQQQVRIEGKTLNITILWCLKILQCNHNVIDVLTLLDTIIRSDVQHSKHNFIPYILEVLSIDGPVMKLLNTETNTEILQNGYQVLEACTTILNIADNHHDKYSKEFLISGKLFIEFLKNSHVLVDAFVLKTLIICLRGLESIINIEKDFLSENLDIILGIIRSYMLLGLKNIDFLKPVRLIAAVVSVPEIEDYQRKGGKIKKQRKTKGSREIQRNQEINVLIESVDKRLYDLTLEDRLDTSRTSDSDYSDSEIKLVNIPKLETRVRLSSLSLFFVITNKAKNNALFSYWSHFVPENMLSGKHNLITSILEDKSPKARTSALNILRNLLSMWKLYLLQAELLEKSSSFTTFSSSLGHMLVQLHHWLNLALNDTVTNVLVEVLKVYVALIQAASYHKLPPGLIIKTVRRIKQFIYHSDSRVQETALIVLSCILTSEPTVPETKQIFIQNKEQSNTEQPIEQVKEEEKVEEEFEYAEFSSDEEELFVDISYEDMPWILERCLINLDPLNESTEKVKIESINVIASACRHYFDSLILKYLKPIEKTLNIYLGSKNSDLLRLNSGKCVDFIGQSMDRFFDDTTSDSVITLGLNFWQNLLNGSLTTLIQSEKDPAIKAIGCDCLGGMGSLIFENLTSDKQILCITLLFACSRDEASSVRGSAIRSLGILVSCQNLREDIGFMVDVSEAIHRALLNDIIAVKVKASWSLGNLSENLIINRDDCDLEQIPDSLLIKLLDVAVKCSTENDRIKMNVARAIGQILQLVSEDMLQYGNYRMSIDKAVESLVNIASASNMMKVRWNACYAIGCVLSNTELIHNNSEWQTPLFLCLHDLVVNCKNFKVRINAASALSSARRKEIYGPYYIPTWISLFESLGKSQNMEEHSEYQHRDQLVEQICLTLGHLAALIQLEDLHHLSDQLNIYSDLLKTQVLKVYDILVPEKSIFILMASGHLANMPEEKITNSDALQSLRILKDIFVQ